MEDAIFPIAVLLAVVNRALIEYLTAPIKKRYPDADLWWLVYVAFATGGAIGWVAGVNLFGAITEMPVVLGRILTAACIGGGANLLHDIAKRRDDALPELDANATPYDAEFLYYESLPDAEPKQ